MKKRILVVDDEPLLLDLLSHLLSAMGYDVERANNSGEAAGKLKEQEYDLIFLDMKMPHVDGRALYSKVREYFPRMAERIVFLTGDVANQETLNFIKGTGNLHLRKPFMMKEVKDLLGKFFQTVYR